MAISHNLGFPRIGPHRELKTLVESYWKGQIDNNDLSVAADKLRNNNLLKQRELGIDLIPVGDFALYDHMLNMTALLGAIPERFLHSGREVGIDTYFAMARGTKNATAMEMTKWFDTNYHYIVPEFTPDTEFHIASNQLFREVTQAFDLGIIPKVVLVGPLTYLYLGKEKVAGFDRLSLLDQLLPVYRGILKALADLGIEWVQMDEPILGLDLPEKWVAQFDRAYASLCCPELKILLATYFESVEEHAARLIKLPVQGLHIDLCAGKRQLDVFLNNYPDDKILSLGVVNGRNIWHTDLSLTLPVMKHAQDKLGERLWIAPSCSLLHCPVDLENEVKLDEEIKEWLAFSVQKLEEVSLLTKGLNQGDSAIRDALDRSGAIASKRSRSPRINNPVVQEKIKRLKSSDVERKSSFSQRQRAQQNRFNLPLFPTTTIGSFPQTAEIRKIRAAFKKGDIGFLKYLEAMRAEIRLVVKKQEILELDVLVHGEPERNDMVEYFGENLWGYAFTENGWVQSYGSRCVKPPIIYGDVCRPEAITVSWSKYAQSLTRKPMKGMLTGPITMLQWSFVRDDQPRSETAFQLALAIREEVLDLESAGVGMIQIDEPAIREGLPLKKSKWDAYLGWAVKAFKLASAGVRDDTQIHTHMCYAEFNDILPAIAALDADVITIETSRSDMELLDGFGRFKYPNEIGPGVYDIHSPRVPSREEMVHLLEKACTVIDPKQLWVNPDCGLKTRNWPEVEAALQSMVEAAKLLRSRWQSAPYHGSKFEQQQH